MSYNPFDELLHRLERIEMQNSQLLKELSTLKQVPVPAEYLTRDEAAAFLQVSLKTLGAWTKEGIVSGYRIASRVRYKKDELEISLKKIRLKSVA